MKKIIILLVCLVWFGFIFYNSTKPGDVSNAKSYSLLNKIRTEYRQLDGEEKKQYNELPKSAREEKLNLIIRKNAHAFEYCVLAVIVSLILFQFGLKGKGAVIYIMFICLFYAVLDEFHQIYVPGRTSSVRDVLIDFVGSLIGICVYYLVYYLFFNKKKRSRGIFN
ncbi:VanZ like family protein [Clostridium acidisoli DSM 12555]|jgi:VanZ family protein|uniref:VanZ like family protein n=1 Tax=Clostridium acidisoli DSM 12555 TaxID=1121291 RepID=A0A1W1XIB9_9CLOT|nr:VanZ family protein [Clostridium acidisoli]SMC23251.1 VanZ like family protein [Clostridium acidisoli DSM 12555]